MEVGELGTLRLFFFFQAILSRLVEAIGAGSATEPEISRVFGRVFRPGGLSPPKPQDHRGDTVSNFFWRSVVERGRGSSFVGLAVGRREDEARLFFGSATAKSREESRGGAGPYKTAREGPWRCEWNPFPTTERARGPAWSKGGKKSARNDGNERSTQLSPDWVSWAS